MPLGRVLEDRQHHHRVGLRRLEDPGLLRAHRLDDAGAGRERDRRRRAVGDRVGHRQRVRRGRRADDRVDLVLQRQPPRVDDRGARIAGVVEHDVFDRLAGDRLRQQRDRVLLGDAERDRRAGGRQRDADLDLGERRQCGEAEEREGEQ